ncbi:MAG: tRNA pseudouridine(55) synthase TruB [Bacteroidetes bacterium]|nr:tRNA pseudouridine(55) synthase TruB [Bacteroidota bacterium]
MSEFLEGKTLLFDKPLTWTSFDVVNKIRWHLKQKLGVKKIKVGHAGTLDPLATGLLIVCTGKHTKTIDSIMGGVKTYTGTFLLGKTTPCYDLEQAFDAEYPVEHITQEMMQQVVQTFIGVQQQFPPIFSAKQVDGKRAYDLAREGKEIVMKSNEIEIHAFTINTSRFPEVDFEITCSKGTYIRSIANDFGKKLKSGATLTALRRTKSGDFSIENAHQVEKWIDDLMSGE